MRFTFSHLSITFEATAQFLLWFPFNSLEFSTASVVNYVAGCSVMNKLLPSKFSSLQLALLLTKLPSSFFFVVPTAAFVALHPPGGFKPPLRLESESRATGFSCPPSSHQMSTLQSFSFVHHSVGHWCF